MGYDRTQMDHGMSQNWTGRSGSFITILGDNSWRRGTTGLKHFGSFHVPESLVPICRIQDGQNRKVKIAPDGRNPKNMILHVSSGHELYIPTEYQDVIRIARYVEFTILDYKPAKHRSLIRLLDVDEAYREGGGNSQDAPCSREEQKARRPREITTDDGNGPA